jgi:ammonia channel protein AmtB
MYCKHKYNVSIISMQIPFGDQVRMLPGLPEGGDSTTVSEHIFMLFQLMFAIITAAIISGAVVQKMKYIWFMIFVLVWHIFIYCPLAHYLFYSDGWLFQYGALDFAGGMVVHTSSGISALVLTFWLGKHVEIAPATPHHVPNVMLGASLLWFGWFGYAYSCCWNEPVVAHIYVCMCCMLQVQRWISIICWVCCGTCNGYHTCTFPHQ